MAVQARSGIAASGSNTAPKVTVPADAQVGDILIVHLSLNNTDVITAEPANLTTIGTNIAVSGGAQFTSRLYWGHVDGIKISAGTVLTWATSVTRTWSAVLQGYSGVNTTTPIHAHAQVQSTNAHVSPTITTTVTSQLTEIVSFKPSTATRITSMAPASGWALRQVFYPAGTFTPAEAAAGYDAGNPVPPGTYGGNTWTLDTSSNPEALYTLALLPAVDARSGSVALSGSGSLEVSGKPAVAGSAALSGSSGPTLAGKPAMSGSASLGAPGSLGLASAVTLSGALTRSGDGTLTLSGSPKAAGSLGLSGSGSISFSPGSGYSGTLTLSGTGTLAASGRSALAKDLALSGSGTLTLSGAATRGGALNLSGSGSLTAAGTASLHGTLALSGASSLALNGQPATGGTVTLTGSGTLTLEGSALSGVPADITVVAHLDDQTWTATLTPRKPSALLDPQPWEGNLE